MKNTAKKILALVFAVAMICTLAVPAFAADTVSGVTIKFVKPAVDGNGNYDYDKSGATAISGITIEVGDTLHDVLNNSKMDAYIDYSKSKGIEASQDATLEKALEDAEGKWVVAVNGVVVDDVQNYVIAKNDVIVIYWVDSVIDTKLVMVDYEQVLSGVISFYYIDAEGNRQPVKGLNVEVNSLVNALSETAGDKVFVTDEDGQIWIAPADLVAMDEANATITYENRAIANAKYTVKLSDEAYSKEDADYYAKFGGLNYVTVTATQDAKDLFKGDAYDAPNTGDMTMVYVLVAAAAIVTLGAVVVMKKKAVKAN